MNKRLLGGLLAAGIIGGGVYGFAASLEPTSDNLGAGSDVVASCDTDGIDVSYSVGYLSTGYEVTSVDLSDVASTCDDQDFLITLSGENGASLIELEGTVDQIDGNQQVDLDTGSDIAAELVEGIHVVVTNAAA